MQIRLEKRAEESRGMVFLTPVLAVVLTMITGAVIFSFIGYDGIGAVREIFLTPLTNPLKWQDLGVKAAPLILIGVGLAVGYQANVWNIGAEGQYVVGALAGTGVALMTWGMQGWWILPLMLIAGIIGGMAYAAIPAFLKVRLQVSEILSSLMLTYVAIQLLYYLVQGPWKDPTGFGFPQTRLFTPEQSLPTVIPGTVVHLGVPISIAIALLFAFIMARSIFGFQIRVVGLAPQAARYGGFSSPRTVWLALLISGGLAGLAGILEAAGPFGQMVPAFPTNYGFSAIIVAFLGRLNPLGVILAGLVLAITYVGGEVAQTTIGLPKAATGLFQALMLFYLLASDILIGYRVVVKTSPRGGAGPMSVEFAIAILVTVVGASTPILLAALGELVVEKSGVLNLGLEGMMLVGAVSGFAVTFMSGSPWLGVLAALAAGALAALIFGFLTLTLSANQVATGLALTIFGVGLSALMGEGFVGKTVPIFASFFPESLAGDPVWRVIFGYSPIVYFSLAMVAAVGWFLRHTRAGLILRAVGENDNSAHSIGYSVTGVRYGAVAFGGAMAGVAGAFFSMVLIPMWTEQITAGRGWIALALVVFSGWRPYRLLAGAYLFGGVMTLELHAKAAGFSFVAPEFWAALPYLATIAVLAAISMRKGGASSSPACLGKPFRPNN